MKKVFRKSFGDRVHAFMYAVEEFEKTGVLGNFYPCLFKLITSCYVSSKDNHFKDVSDDYKVENYTQYKIEQFYFDENEREFWNRVAKGWKPKKEDFKKAGLKVPTCYGE